MTTGLEATVLDEVARVVGAPVSLTRERLRDVVEATRDREEEIRSSLAGPRLARRIVLTLPVASVGMGVLLGFNPIGVLVETPVGWSFLLGGALLVIIGWRWMARLERQARNVFAAPGLTAEALALAVSGGLPVSVAWRLISGAVPPECLSDAEVLPVVHVVTSSMGFGQPIVPGLRRVADERRRQVHHDGLRTARELGERILVPMGTCLLPAFLLWGVAPVVYAMVTDSLSGSFA